MEILKSVFMTDFRRLGRAWENNGLKKRALPYKKKINDNSAGLIIGGLGSFVFFFQREKVSFANQVSRQPHVLHQQTEPRNSQEVSNFFSRSVNYLRSVWKFKNIEQSLLFFLIKYLKNNYCLFPLDEIYSIIIRYSSVLFVSRFYLNYKIRCVFLRRILSHRCVTKFFFFWCPNFSVRPCKIPDRKN